MEAHAGTITIRTGSRRKPRRRYLAEIRQIIRLLRIERAEHVRTLRANRPTFHTLPGSDHSHLVLRPRDF